MALLAASAMVALGGCGGGGKLKPAHQSVRTRRSRSPARAAATTTPPKGLAIGLTESNANLLWSAAARPELAPGFGPWREDLSALHPAYLRLVIDWAQLQPQANVAPTLSGPVDGCLRGTPPCGAYAGLRDELQAIASQQSTQGGFQVVLVIDGVPAWAAQPPSGCERPGTVPGARPIAPAALADYRDLIRSVLALGRSLGVSLPYLSPWNEPNHPQFLSPQRAACDTSSPSLAPAVYAELAGAMAAELQADGGSHQMLMGELAGFTTSGARDTSIGEFIADLPADVVCMGSIWTVHAYARRWPAVLAAGPVGELESALDERGHCGQRARIWVTETGAGAPHAGDPRPPGVADEKDGCRALYVEMLRWYADPRVDAVFQYTFREDNLYPVGLANPALTQLYPAYYLWKAWGGTRPAGAPPPPLPAQCA